MLARTEAEWEAIESLVQDSPEATVVEAARSGGTLNDKGWRIFRRVEARTPDMRAKLKAYNRVYTARKRRVESGKWPEDAPTAEEAVGLGILAEAERYQTKPYVKAVNTYLAPDVKPVEVDASAYVKTVKTPSTVTVTVIGEAKTATPEVEAYVKPADVKTTVVKPSSAILHSREREVASQIEDVRIKIRLVQAQLDKILGELEAIQRDL